MDLSEYKLDERDIVALTQIDSCPSAIAILNVAKQIHDKELSRIRDGLIGVSDSEPRHDFRHSIGAASTAAKLLGLRNEALRLMEENNKAGGRK